MAESPLISFSFTCPSNATCKIIFTLVNNTYFVPLKCLIIYCISLTSCSVKSSCVFHCNLHSWFLAASQYYVNTQRKHYNSLVKCKNLLSHLPFMLFLAPPRMPANFSRDSRNSCTCPELPGSSPQF